MLAALLGTLVGKDRGADRIADLLNLCEREGRCPDSTEDVIIQIIPKAAGGRRPISLLAAIIRV